jgi:hypothetical protein
MDNDKSILEKFTDTVKGIASTAADAASAALRAEEPPLKDNDVVAVPLPLGAAGLVSDPMLVPPIAAPAPRRRKRTVSKRKAGPAQTSAKKSGKKAAKKTARKTAKKTAPRTAKKAVKKTAKKATRKTAKQSAARKSSKKSKTAVKRKAKAAKKGRKAGRRSR